LRPGLRELGRRRVVISSGPLEVSQKFPAFL
jgi:hypothetical protein